MKNDIEQATHNHKRAGAVRLLESTNELAKVVVPSSGDEFWVKLTDLTQVGSVIEKSKPAKKQSAESRPNATTPKSRYRVVRAA
jgi:hypothetical protein